MIVAAGIANHLFTIGTPVAEKIVRTILVYLGLVVLLRIGGKRDLAQINSFDLVVLMLLSNVVQNAIIGDDNSLAGGLLGAFTLFCVNAVVVRVSRSNAKLDRALEGSPTTIVTDGNIDRGAIRREGLAEADVLNAVRRQGANTIDEVQSAVLMPGGAIVVTLRDEDQNASKGDVARLERKLDRLLQNR
jgi:uncharacterized membrane protein YcaP (DUF421 family)